MYLVSKPLFTAISLAKFPQYHLKYYWERFIKNKRYFTDLQRTFIPFDELVKKRRDEARRSLVVQVNSEQSFCELYEYCSRFGELNSIHHYVLKGELHFMLVEYAKHSNFQQLMERGSLHSHDLDLISIQSPFLWFRSIKDKKTKKRAKSSETPCKLNSDSCTLISEEDLHRKLHDKNSVSEQIDAVYMNTCLNDLGVRLRYVAARQVEMIMQSMYPDITVRPFGSSVNGFGKMGCDLDLVVRTNSDEVQDVSDRRLVYHTKTSASTGKTLHKRHLEFLADVLQLYAPGCNHIRRILQARIPIVKYNQDYTGMECDLSMTNMSAVYMSELLYIYGSFDERVKPLVFTIRKWAQSVGLTNSSPGPWITNFPLTLMVIFFLQQKTKEGPILPSFNYLISKAGKNDFRVTEDYIHCTFLRDIRKLETAFNTINTCDLETLLLQFFEFYCCFNFSDRAISINEGTDIFKSDHSALYIVNPLEPNLNASKNVSHTECEKLKVEMRNAAWKLETTVNRNDNKPWGLLQLFDPPTSKLLVHGARSGNHHRLVNVSDLFKEEEEVVKSDFNFDENSQVKSNKLL